MVSRRSCETEDDSLLTSRLPILWRVAAGQGPLGWYRQCPGDELTKCLGWGSNHFNFVKLVQPRVHVLCEFCLIIRIPIACNFASYGHEVPPRAAELKDLMLQAAREEARGGSTRRTSA